MKDIGLLIKDRRSELKLTLDDVAKELGVNRSTVFRWEKGDIASLKRGHIYILSEILYIPIENFFSEEGAKLEDANIVKKKISVCDKIKRIKSYDDLSQLEKYIDVFFIKK